MKIEPGNVEFGNQLNFKDLIKDKKETKVEFKIISCRDIDNLVLSYKQVVVLLEALYNLKVGVEELNDNEEVGDKKSRHVVKINEINELFNYFKRGLNTILKSKLINVKING